MLISSTLAFFRRWDSVVIFGAVLALGSGFALAAPAEAQTSLLACENNKTHAITFPVVGKSCTSAQTAITLATSSAVPHPSPVVCDAPSDGCCACPSGENLNVTGGGGDCEGGSVMVSSALNNSSTWCISCESISLNCSLNPDNQPVCTPSFTPTVPSDVVALCEPGGNH